MGGEGVDKRVSKVSRLYLKRPWDSWVKERVFNLSNSS